MKLSRVHSIFFCIYIASLLSFSREDNGTDEAELLDSGETSWFRHGLRPLFPMLLKVSSRLSTLVPSLMMVLGGIFVLIMFSKKALLISLLALYFSLKAKFHKDKRKEIVYVGGHHQQELGNHFMYADHHGYDDHHGYADHSLSHYYDHYR